MAKATTTKTRKRAKSKKAAAPSRPRTGIIEGIDVVTPIGAYTPVGYQTVQSANRDGVTATGASGRQHALYDRLSLVELSRAFVRNNSLYYGMLLRAVDYIVGKGVGLNVKSKDEQLNERIEELWRLEWMRPEIKGIISGAQLERGTCLELLIAGDTVLKKLRNGKLQSIESEQVQGKPANRFDGVSLTRAGKIRGFWIAPYNRGGQVDRNRAEFHRTNDILYLSVPDRPSAVRGVPPCQSAFAQLHRINDILDSEAIAWQLLSRLAITINREDSAVKSFGDSTEDPSAKSTDLSSRMVEMGYALIFNAEPGEKIEGISRNIPGQNFVESITMFLRLLGLPLGLPLEIVLLDWTKSNYSQSRAVLEQAFTMFNVWQKLMQDFFYNPIFDWYMDKWQREGKIQLGDGWKDTFVTWIPPTFPWIDPMKEAQAQALKIDRAFVTQSEVIKGLGRERNEVIDGREFEIRDSIERAAKIEKDTGVPVDWRLLAGVDAKSSPPTIELTQDNGSDDEEPENDNEE